MLLSRPAQLTMTPRIMRVELKDRGRQGDEHRLEFQPDTNIPLFENFVATQPSEVLVSVFRQVLNVVHRKQLKDFHLKVQNGWRGSRWKVVLLHGNPDRVGPLVCSRCMSCDLACPLKLGITGHGEEGKLKLLQFLLTFSCKFAKLLALVGLCSADTLITNADGVRAHPELRCWLDAQGRDKLIVTPVKHLSSLSEMDDDLMADFWKGATELIKSLHCLTFKSMILNHGAYQNHAHLHLKINVNERFTQVSQHWPGPLQAQFARLQDFAAQLQELPTNA